MKLLKVLLGQVFRPRRAGVSPARPPEPARGLLDGRPGLEGLEDRTAPAVFTVTSPADIHQNGLLTLREAIGQANGTPGLNILSFALSPGGVQTISLTSGLPTITNPVILDGTTQPGFDGTPLIVLDGSQAGADATGLTITAGNSVVQGLVIDNFAGGGVALAGAGSNLLAGNYIGVDATGTVAQSNGLAALSISAGSADNVIGGTTAAERNLISGNAGFAGIEIFDSGTTGNVVEGNYIGTDVTGTKALGNRGPGVLIDSGPAYNLIGGALGDSGNLISGNQGFGVVLLNSTTSNVVAGNQIGTDVTGSQALENLGGVSIQSGASENIIGGASALERNIISGNSGSGIELRDSGTTGNIVEGNYIGTDATGTRALGNTGHGVSIQNGADGNVIGVVGAGEQLLPLGSRRWPDAAAGNLISGNAVAGNSYAGVSIGGGTTDNVIAGNFIGTDSSGTTTTGTDGKSLGNHWSGVRIDTDASNNTVGGTTADAGNVISGNFADGVDISGSGNLVAGNAIGTDVSRTSTTDAQGQPLGNNVVLASQGGGGVVIWGGASLNTVGGTTAEATNVISGNYLGVTINSFGTSSNVVKGNYIGTDATGTRALGNYSDGIRIFAGASRNIIGGTEPGAGNLISGNAYAGVHLLNVGTTGNVVEGNYIGTDATGTLPLGNSNSGVILEGGASSNFIGGTRPEARNILSDNGGVGVAIGDSGTTGNVVRGNYIGTDVTGTSALGNVYHGVAIYNGASHNTIGGTSAGARNLLSGNDYFGIAIYGGGTTANIVAGNYIGTDVTGTLPLGNQNSGVIIQQAANGNTIGGVSAGASNVIAFNGNDGVQIDNGVGNTIRHNSIFDNAHLGIELLEGGNNGQPAPTVNTASFAGTNLTITGTLQAAPETLFILEFFVNPTLDDSGSSQGRQFLGFILVTTNSSGMASFTATFSSGDVVGQYLDATATDSNGNTSGFSAWTQVAG